MGSSSQTGRVLYLTWFALAIFCEMRPRFQDGVGSTHRRRSKKSEPEIAVPSSYDKIVDERFSRGTHKSKRGIKFPIGKRTGKTWTQKSRLSADPNCTRLDNLSPIPHVADRDDAESASSWDPSCVRAPTEDKPLIRENPRHHTMRIGSQSSASRPHSFRSSESRPRNLMHNPPGTSFAFDTERSYFQGSSSWYEASKTENSYREHPPTTEFYPLRYLPVSGSSYYTEERNHKPTHLDDEIDTSCSCGPCSLGCCCFMCWVSWTCAILTACSGILWPLKALGKILFWTVYIILGAFQSR